MQLKKCLEFSAMQCEKILSSAVDFRRGRLNCQPSSRTAMSPLFIGVRFDGRAESVTIGCGRGSGVRLTEPVDSFIANREINSRQFVRSVDRTRDHQSDGKHICISLRRLVLPTHTHVAPAARDGVSHSPMRVSISVSVSTKCIIEARMTFTGTGRREKMGKNWNWTHTCVGRQSECPSAVGH